MIGYDWTFAIGANTWDSIDYKTILTQKYLVSDVDAAEQKMPDDDNENDEDDVKAAGPAHSKRKVAYKIDTSWLVTVSDREFVYSIDITPGLMSNFYRI